MAENPEYVDDIETVHNALLAILQRHPQGLSEYALFRELAATGLQTFDKSVFADDHGLFCRHFILFHCLYRLRDELLEKRHSHLEISALNICLHPWAVGTEGLVRHDPLRDYYLDIVELEKITPQDVTDMLGRFWASYHTQEGRHSALKILGLEEPAEPAAIRKQYRQLAMQHHPDRGGDTRRFQEINAAMRLLERSLPVS